MNWQRGALAVVASALVAASLAAVGSGGPSVSKQRIAIEGTLNALTGKSTWVLIPLTKGKLGRDSGSGTGTGVPRPALLRTTGQRVIPIKGEDLLIGKQGAIALEEDVNSHNAGRGYSADLGTWSFTGQLGVYEGYSGGGGVAVIGLPNGNLLFRMEGYVSR